jgi:hypothetical protein
MTITETNRFEYIPRTFPRVTEFRWKKLLLLAALGTAAGLAMALTISLPVS